MRIAALYDIHGNLPALEATLASVARAAVDAIVIGGDVVPGPMPDESLDLIFAAKSPIHCLRGNGERAVLDVLGGKEPGGVPEQARPVIEWNAAQLRVEHERWIASWPATVRLHVGALGEVLFCHATPRSDSEIFTRETDDARVAPAFADAGAAIVVCGHTHMVFDRIVGSVRIVNAGSVGMPFGATGASWLLLDTDIHFEHTPFDLGAAASRVRATRYPMAEHFAAHSILAVPSEAEMLARFKNAEL